MIQAQFERDPSTRLPSGNLSGALAMKSFEPFSVAILTQSKDHKHVTSISFWSKSLDFMW